ncbi:MAG: MBL fold metallo-hydrolase [Desulfobacterales bacterium]|jgi:phosphoribosyl 1,2-cyclic phosphodiesterase|nr:MBL fold metallo-hydrolase [Desulfobacterales bacterium]
MIITCWGSRGSISVSGKDYIKYGGDTTCVEIVTKTGDTLIVDAGTGIRRLGYHLYENKRNSFHLLFTHAHWDHVIGFPFFRPLFSKEVTIVLHSGPFSIKGIRRVLADTMAPPHFPVSFDHIEARIEYRRTPASAFSVGALQVIPIPISHPNNGFGYKFIEDGKTFVFLTDNELNYIHPHGLSIEAYIDFAAGADLLFHDAEFTPQEYQLTAGWGHSVYTDALELARSAGVKTLGFFHLNQERSDQQLDRLMNTVSQDIQKNGYGFDCLAVGCGMRFKI